MDRSSNTHGRLARLARGTGRVLLWPSSWFMGIAATRAGLAPQDPQRRRMAAIAALMTVAALAAWAPSAAILLDSANILAENGSPSSGVAVRSVVAVATLALWVWIPSVLCTVALFGQLARAGIRRLIRRPAAYSAFHDADEATLQACNPPPP